MALGQFDQTQQQNLTDYTSGKGSFQTQGPAFFQNTGDAARITGGTGGNSAAFATTISALRVNVTVHDGRSQFRLAAVVTAGNAAQTVQTTATPATAKPSASGSSATNPPATAATAAPSRAATAATATGQNAASRNLNYPFTLLEIRENDEIPPPPPPPPPPP